VGGGYAKALEAEGEGVGVRVMLAADDARPRAGPAYLSSARRCVECTEFAERRWKRELGQARPQRHPILMSGLEEDRVGDQLRYRCNALSLWPESG